ncbi:hypothetical protein CLOM_g10810, partial [Closterium sp. NIES-68]
MLPCTCLCLGFVIAAFLLLGSRLVVVQQPHTWQHHQHAPVGAGHVE